MISYFPKNSAMSKLRELENTEFFNFRLTGSRFFETEGYDSDWDFFTEDSDIVRNFLKDRGFMPTLAYRGDATVEQVFQYQGEALTIHVQLVGQEMIQVKETAQNIIKKCGLVSHEKGVMTQIWRAVIATLLFSRKDC